MKIKLKSNDSKDEKFEIEEKLVYTKSEEDTMYKIVRDYLYDNQGANAIRVSEDTGVPRAVIMMFLRQGKVSLAENVRHLLHPCKQCGALIEYGDICTECKAKKMNSILNPTVETKKNISGYSSNSINSRQEKGYGRRIRQR